MWSDVSQLVGGSRISDGKENFGQGERFWSGATADRPGWGKNLAMAANY